MSEPVLSSLRVDKWLWQARFFKSRMLAKTIVESGKVRLNGSRISKASKAVVAGDILTFPFADDIMVCEIKAMGTRRGPASEAQTLYTVLEPPEKPASRAKSLVVSSPGREKGSGRPTKKQRRAIDKWHQKGLD